MKKMSSKRVEKICNMLTCIIFWLIGGLYVLNVFHPIIGYIMGTLAIISFMYFRFNK